MTPRIVVYTSDQSHSSIARAARRPGFGPEQVRVIPTDASFRMQLADVRAAMDADIEAGRLPFLVAAVAGSTNTGAVDDLAGLAALCRDRGVWLHVDAAYGGFAVLTERGRAALAGLEQAELRHARPTQVAGDAVRGRLPDGPAGRPARTGLRDPPRISQGARHRGRRQLRRSQPAIDPRDSRHQGVALVEHVRGGCLPGRDRSGDGPHRAGGARDRRGSAAAAGDPGRPGHRDLPAPRARCSLDGPGGSRQPAARGFACPGWRGPSDGYDHPRTLRDPAVHPEPHDRCGRRAVRPGPRLG